MASKCLKPERIFYLRIETHSSITNVKVPKTPSESTEIKRESYKIKIKTENETPKKKDLSADLTVPPATSNSAERVRTEQSLLAGFQSS